MTVWTNNVKSPYIGQDYWGGHLYTWMMREILLTAGWTENSNNGDANWAGANIIVDEASEPSGYSVNVANPLQITSPTGVFTQTMISEGHLISLRATNDGNCGVYRIVTLIDANNIMIAPEQWNATVGWTTETGITGRIICPIKAKVNINAWVLLDAPVGDSQLRFWIDASWQGVVAARPKGQIADPTETTGCLASINSARRFRFTAVIDKASNRFYSWAMSDVIRPAQLYMFDLQGVSTSDTHPTLLACKYDTGYPNAWDVPMYGVSHLGNSVQHYPLQPKRFSDQSDDSYGVYEIFGRRFVNGRPGKISMVSPYVVLDNVAGDGGYPRGRFPSQFVRYTTKHLANYTLLNVAGEFWLYVSSGLVIKWRAGNMDLLPSF